uniref:Uncharacterized protein n=1 Tax=Globodera pallida TaxID=36090 RepID=A0A183BL44_GLOPA
MIWRVAKLMPQPMTSPFPNLGSFPKMECAWRQKLPKLSYAVEIGLEDQRRVDRRRVDMSASRRRRVDHRRVGVGKLTIGESASAS